VGYEDPGAGHERPILTPEEPQPLAHRRDPADRPEREPEEEERADGERESRLERHAAVLERLSRDQRRDAAPEETRARTPRRTPSRQSQTVRKAAPKYRPKPQGLSRDQVPVGCALSCHTAWIGRREPYL
jgi:hypothetical protein